MNHFHRYKPLPESEPPDELLQYGITKLDLKGAYVDQEKVIYPNFGEMYGRNLGNSENQKILEDIIDLSKNYIVANDIDERIKSHIDEMNLLGYSPVMFLKSSHWLEYSMESKLYQAEWKLANEVIELLDADGLFDETTFVFSTHTMNENTVVLVDLSAFATLCQYRPSEKTDFPLYISIEELDLQKANEILEANPDWGIDDTEEEMSEEEAIRKIQQRVHLQILERFQLEDIDQKACRVLTFEKQK